MATLTIRNLPSDIYERLRERARQNRRSLTQEAAFIIEQALSKTQAPEGPWRGVQDLRELIQTRYGRFADSAGLVREDRER